MPKIELGRFRVLPGKEGLVREWLTFLNQHLRDVLLTLEQEKMYVEAIFQEEIAGASYLYWFSVQGENAVEVTDSDFEVDKKHMAYWEACIDPEYGEELLETKVVLIPDKIKAVMND